MTQEMLMNAVHPEQKRMAIVEDGKLMEFDIQMSFKEPITGNIYKGIVQKVERGLQAAFVDFGGKKDGFLPLRDVSPEYFTEANGRDGHHPPAKPFLKMGQELLVQVLREVSGQKGALLTTYISLPGRYLVLLPNKQSSGVSRKIEDESERKHLKEAVEQIKKQDGIGFIVRTAGMNRTKQELSRDYQHLLRLWHEIKKKANSVRAPALIYQESDFGIRSLRDYFTSEIAEIWVDDPETFKRMRAYCKAIAPRHQNMIKLCKEKNPLFDKYNLEDQIRTIYQERVNLKSGGYIVIKPTEAMITIDVNSGKASHKRNVEETAFKANIEAAEEVARQLRLRDLGGLIAVDFIDMIDRKHIAEVEKTFKRALSIDRARIQMARISKFGILELSRQKKHPTIQEISYINCPFCHGSGIRPSLEYTALAAFRKMESQAVKGNLASLKVSLPYEVASYLLNQKRSEICKLEEEYEMDIHVSGIQDMAWDAVKIETTARRLPTETEKEEKHEREEGEGKGEEVKDLATTAGEAAPGVEEGAEVPKKKSRRRRRKKKKAALVLEEAPLSEGATLGEAVPPGEIPFPEEAVPLVAGPSLAETIPLAEGAAPEETGSLTEPPEAEWGKAPETPQEVQPEAPAETLAVTVPPAEESPVGAEEAAGGKSETAVPKKSRSRRRPYSRRSKKKAAPERPFPDVIPEEKEQESAADLT